MGQKRKLKSLEDKLGQKLPYFICGLLNQHGVKGAAKILGVHWRTLEFELMRWGIERRWVVLDNTYLRLYELMEPDQAQSVDN